MAGEVVRVKNVGKQEFRGNYEQQPYVIPPSAQVIVPEEAAMHWMGRWGLIDREFDPQRKNEYKRLRALYGAHFSDENGDENAKWEENRPRLEVFSLDDERIETVIDDPGGDRITVAKTTKREQVMLEDEVRRLSSQLKAMESALAQKAMGDNYVATDDSAPLEDIPDDQPTKVPVGGRNRGRDQR